MPKVEDSEGNVIANLPYTDEGIEQAEGMKEANPNLDVDYAPGGTYDGGGRVKQMYAGGGLTGYSAIGAERPMYKEGGEVKKHKEITPGHEEKLLNLMEDRDKVKEKYWESYHKGEKSAKHKYSKVPQSERSGQDSPLKDPNLVRRHSTKALKKRLDKLNKKIKDRDYK
tara:strand:- start:4649 stop:5155 length:507 start_codon:yes stop_codon:yes gene_type:complete